MIKSPKAKGNRLERKAKAYYQNQNYLCVKAGGSLGRFDLICLAIPPYDYDKPAYILSQVKANRCSKSERSLIKNFPVPPGTFTVKHIIIYKDYSRSPQIEIYA